MAECGDGRQQQWEAVQGPMTHLWTWQQHEESVRGPWQITGLQQHEEGGYRGHAPYHKNGNPTNSVRST
ncbi:unnamed protein product [Staurois parvus]|uniref:Uncharacterized protein n=1 Tax=Staurois parvus TaxID=386267 RepID=A0ABN9AV02_9NEOB|nr:unnamed protein product [Staurois parvus]